MANLSSAMGTITIDSDFIQKNLEETKTLIYLIYKTGVEFEYSTQIELSDAEFNLKQAYEYDTDFMIEFTGTGKWTFSNTLNYFFQSLEEVSKIKDTDKIKERKERLKLMQAIKNFEGDFLEFKYVDFESGCDVYYAEKVSLNAIIDNKFKVLSTIKNEVN